MQHIVFILNLQAFPLADLTYVSREIMLYAYFSLIF